MVCNRTTRFIPYILDDQLKFKTKLMPTYTDMFKDTCAIVLFGLIVGGAACIAEDIYGKLKE